MILARPGQVDSFNKIIVTSELKLLFKYQMFQAQYFRQDVTATPPS